MNIIVITADGHVTVRPDTTWEKDNEDFFPPEFVEGLAYTPVLFARVSKPGRSVSAKFADRYYDGINYGVLLYPENLLDGSETGFACASCIDHTSFLPFPLYNKVTLGREGNVFKISTAKPEKQIRKVFGYNEGTAQMIENAIEQATRCVYIRTGDLIAIELQPRKHLCKAEDGQVRVRMTYCNNETKDFNIRF